MKLRNIIVLTTIAALNGCSGANPYSNGTTYGIPDSKWAVMSHSQKQSASELFDLETQRVEEQQELNEMKTRKLAADAIRHREQNEEQVQIDQQQRKVDAIRNKELFKQKQREHELDSLKGSSAKPN